MGRRTFVRTAGGILIATTGFEVACTDVLPAAPRTTGTLQVNVTGLSGSPANGGSAVAQRTDAAGSPITINISAAGSGSNSSVPAGTYTVTYTPPSGFNVNSGVPNPVTGVVVSAGLTATVPFAVTATGTFQTPDIINNESFETGWGLFVGDSQGDPPSAVRDSTLAAPGKGLWSAKGAWTPNGGNDTGFSMWSTFYGSANAFGAPASGTGANGSFTRSSGTWTAGALVGRYAMLGGGSRLKITSNTTTTVYFAGDATGATQCYIMGWDRLWARFYFRFTAQVDSIWKFSRWYDTGFTNGMQGLFFGNLNYSPGGFRWAFTNNHDTNIPGCHNADIVDSQWHSFEYEYWAYGDPTGEQSAAFWLDGVQKSYADGTLGDGNPVNTDHWLGGRLYSGDVQGGPSGNKWLLDTCEWIATLNHGCTTTGQVNLDYMALSSLGRSGP